VFGGFKILIPPRANETAFASSARTHTHGRTVENISDQWGATDFNCFFLFYLFPGRWRGGGVIGVSRAIRKVVQTHTHTHRAAMRSVLPPLRRFLFVRARTHTVGGSDPSPLEPYGSIFSQRFPFSFCRARAPPPPPFVITPRLKIPYVATAYPFLLYCHPLHTHTHIYIIICRCVWGSLLLCVHTCVCVFVITHSHTHNIYVIYFLRLCAPCSSFLSAPATARIILFATGFSSNISIFAQSLLFGVCCLSVRKSARVCVCVSTYRFFPLICVYIYVYINI